jgi:hypothetical protein
MAVSRVIQVNGVLRMCYREKVLLFIQIFAGSNIIFINNMQEEKKTSMGCSELELVSIKKPTNTNL